MMDNVHDLELERALRKPHFSVIAQCVLCAYVWEAIFPPGTVPNVIQCPDCSREHRGESRVKRSAHNTMACNAVE